mmetsp:Transcript_18469/g.61047  ORF Transcript_18469/g.61047 Transcript_18469/m.61047 type:complete len:211 (-) Transcript_18469:492-1124(-)
MRADPLSLPARRSAPGQQRQPPRACAQERARSHEAHDRRPGKAGARLRALPQRHPCRGARGRYARPDPIHRRAARAPRQARQPRRRGPTAALAGGARGLAGARARRRRHRDAEDGSGGRARAQHTARERLARRVCGRRPHARVCRARRRPPPKPRGGDGELPGRQRAARLRDQPAARGAGAAGARAAQDGGVPQQEDGEVSPRDAAAVPE